MVNRRLIHPLSVLLSGVWLVLASVMLHASELSPEARWIKAIDNDDTATIHAMVDALATLQPPMPKPDIVTTASGTGKTAFMIACKTDDLALAKKLHRLGADVHRSTNTGGTPFMYASLGNSQSIAEYLLSFDVDIDAQGSNGWSAATIAAAKGYTDMLAYLLTIGVDANAPDVYQWSPLMRAADNRHYAAVERLLKTSSIKLDTQSDTGNTALHIAAANGDSRMIKLLLDAGSDPGIANAQGVIPVQLVAGLPNGEMLTSLFESD